MKRWTFFFSLMSLLLAVTGVAAEAGSDPDVAFISLRSLSPADAQGVAAPFLSAKGRARFEESRRLLIIYDYPENIQQARQAVRAVDGASTKIRIQVSFGEAYRAAGTGVQPLDVRGLHWKGRARGGRAAAAGDMGAVDLRSPHSVLAADGCPARIWVGESVAEPAQVLEHGILRGWWKRDDMRDQAISASLWVRPRVLSDGAIEIRVYPRLTVRGKSPSTVDVTEVGATVRAADGETAAAGSLDTAGRDLWRGLFGVGGVFDGRRLAIALTPRIQ